MKQLRPLLSIVTVVLNGEKYITKTIESIVNQKQEEIEYIIKDGLSTDSTILIIEKYISQIDYFCSTADNGISDAFNQAIDLCKGQYILFVNSDDWLEDNAISIIVNHIRELSNEPDVISYGVNFWNNNKLINRAFSNPDKIIFETSIHHCSSLVSCKAFATFGCFDLSFKYAMDYDLFLRIKMNGGTFLNIKTFISNRRLGGISYRNNFSAIRETLKARSVYFNFLNSYYWFLKTLIKNNLGRILKSIGLIELYNYYWLIVNKSIK